MANGIATTERPYLPTLPEDTTLSQIIAENMGSELDPFSFERVRVPAQGGLTWELDTPEGETTSQKELRCVVLAWSIQRTYWKEQPSGEGAQPPDCMSRDGKEGFVQSEQGPRNTGDRPDCSQCPLNTWGSSTDPESNAKACKEMRVAAILRPGELLPSLLVLPPSSIKGWRTFTQRVSRKGRFLWQVESIFTLTRVSGRFRFSVIDGHPAAILDQETIQAMSDLRNAVQPLLGRVELSSDDYKTDDA